MKSITNCLFFAFGVVSTIAVAMLYLRVSCRQVGTVERVRENINETLDEASQAIGKGAKIVEEALKKASK